MAARLTSDPEHAWMAFRAMFEQTGIRWDEVLLPSQWKVVLVDGVPELVVNPEGVRAAAILAPRPDASEVAEAMIEQARAEMTRRTLD
jgi:hypothetical protein